MQRGPDCYSGSSATAVLSASHDHPSRGSDKSARTSNTIFIHNGAPQALAGCYLWRAVDHEGEVLEAVVTAKRDKAAALKFLKRIMKKYGRPLSVVTDGLCSYPAAMKEIGNADRQEAGRRLNNRAENSHQPFRRRERAMQRFRSMKTLQKFSSVHAQVHNHFNQERHVVTRQVYKQRRSAALAEWRALAA